VLRPSEEHSDPTCASRIFAGVSREERQEVSLNLVSDSDSDLRLDPVRDRAEDS